MKKIYYSKSMNSFYDSTIHFDNIPEDCLEITSDEHQHLINATSLSNVSIQSNEYGLPCLVEYKITKVQNKLIADQKLLETDWVNQPDVYDSNLPLHLENRDDFLMYRAIIRKILVDPNDGNIDWPDKPKAMWSTVSVK